MNVQHHGGLFNRFAKHAATATGHPLTFISAVALVIVWAISGPFFGFSENWQLVINTSTTIITFLMVFLIQNTQNRDSQAMQIKLDEIIRATEGAHNALLDLEELTDQELHETRESYLQLAHEAREELRDGKPDTARGELHKLQVTTGRKEKEPA